MLFDLRKIPGKFCDYNFIRSVSKIGGQDMKDRVIYDVMDDLGW